MKCTICCRDGQSWERMRCSSSLPSPHPRSTTRFTPLCSSTPAASTLSPACTAFFAQHVHGMHYVRMHMCIMILRPTASGLASEIAAESKLTRYRSQYHDVHAHCEFLLGSIACVLIDMLSKAQHVCAEQGTAQTHEGCSNQQRCFNYQLATNNFCL